ncbi:hypothetical protein BOX15_Mlig010462g1 [Macrostomum lignano]|uniref:Uncharacterized protein n=1 Tax=Macrostomum lignano TaxID=282301 RepID=A0A267F438_9PLAT|nr:hypothetical protein BOX15_Mlig010462g1 [Macrostomum lignano]
MQIKFPALRGDASQKRSSVSAQGQESSPHSKKTVREICGASGRKTGARSVHARDMPVKLLKIAHEDCMPVSELADFKADPLRAARAEEW